MVYLLDTDIINYLLKAIPPAPDRFLSVTAQGARFVLCPIVHYEVTRYLKLIGAARLLRFYTDLVRDWRRIELLSEDWDAAADLWVQRHRLGKPIQDADLLVAVTALKAGAILVTNNTRHFEELGVVAENWSSVESA